MKPIYNVPVIPQNLRKDETLVQIAEVLNYLTDVANDIFYRVNNRINRNNTNINLLNDRINTVTNKITKLAECGANKATRVFSSSKYPAVDLNKQHVSIFASDTVLPKKHFTVQYNSESPQIENTDALQIYHVKKQEDKKINLQGLGKIPKDVDSVNDLLLFNSGINLYDKYVFSDTLQVSDYKKVDEQDKSEIGDAPLSITKRSTLTRSTGDTYFYSPDLGDVPTIDLPLDLPNLPGIADDVRYVNESGPTIAPSVSFITNSQENVNFEEVCDINISEVELPPPPIIHEPPNEIDKPIEQKAEIQEEINTIEVPIVIEDPVPKIELPVEKINAHASLMEAIRKAGGSKNAKLKSTDSKKSDKPQTGDFMADLHAKLSMRRKGISGEQKQKLETQNHPPVDATSTMNRLLSMIPPVPINADASESNTTEDEDWDD